MSQASVTKVICLLDLRKERTGRVKRAFFSVFNAACSSALRMLNVTGWSFFKRSFCGAASRAKFEMKRRNTLHKPRKERSFVIDLRVLSS